MSTRCQIGFYATAEQPLDQPSALIYRHSDGYPTTRHGVLAALIPWAQAFAVERGLEDAEYAAARGLVALMRAADLLDACTGYGICGDHGLHGDTAYYYRVDPTGITVYDAGDNAWTSLQQLSHHALARLEARS
jgi:hypothetical protein